ncbi:MAG: hypothetical protein L6Q70_16470, partial [Thauera sp.]|nr:hypothetical protein [Thauera sp.]
DIGCTATFSEIPQLPDLHGEWLRVRRLCLPWGQQPLCFLFGRFGLRNSSPVDAGASTVRYYLSADEVVDGGDRAIGSRNVGVMPPGGPRPLAMGVLLRGMTPRGLYVIAVVDADGAVDERDETNNAIVFGPIP